MRAAKAAKGKGYLVDDFSGIAEEICRRIDLLSAEVPDMVEKVGCHLSGEVKGCCMGYLRLKILPLLKTLTRSLCTEQPAEHLGFTVLLLLEQLNAPERALSALRSFLADGARCPAGPVSAGAAEPERGGNGGECENERGAAIRLPVGKPPNQRSPQQRRVHMKGAEEDEEEGRPSWEEHEDPTSLHIDGLDSPIKGSRSLDEIGRSASATLLDVITEEEQEPAATRVAAVRGKRRTLSNCFQSSTVETASLLSSLSEKPGARLWNVIPSSAPEIDLNSDIDTGKAAFSRTVSEGAAMLARLRIPVDSHGPGLDDAKSPLRPLAKAKRKDLLRRTLMGEAGIATVPHDELMELLRGVPFLEQFTEEELQRIAGITELRRFEQDDLIVTFGQNSKELHIVLEGHGRIYVPQQAGVLRKGDFIGEEALKMLGAKSPVMLCSTDGPLTTLAVTQSRFEELAIRAARRVERRTDAIKASGQDGAGRAAGSRPDVEPGYCAACFHKVVEGYEQTPQDKQMITKAVKHNKVLGEVMGLTDEQCTMIADAVHLVEVPAGVLVFRKGDMGTALFIVQEGLLKVHLDKNIDVQLRVGDTFGELALLYDEPRSATIEALMYCRLWVMPRQAFQAVSQISAQRRLMEYAGLLQRVPCLLESIDAHLFEMLAGVVEETVFVEGDDVCAEGEDEGVLFLVYEGECSYLDEHGEKRMLHKGDWMGEEQLVKNIGATRTVSVNTETATILVLQESSYRLVVDASAGKRRGSGAQFHRLKKRSASVCFRQSEHGANHSLERCNVVGALGEGSFGRVLLMRDRENQTEYALKCISKEQLKNEHQETMVKNERHMMTLLNSDFIVRLYRTYEDSVFLYMMLEPVLGGELFDLFTDRDLWGSVEHARFYAACVTLGLAHMHSKRVIWRDLKLENCLINSKGYLKLSDMGIAKVVVGKTYSVCGTVDYFAPETLKQVGHNRAADWWACGVLIFIMIAGQSPFDAPEVAQIYKNIIKGLGKVEFPKSCPPEAEEVVKALCKKKPEDRVTMQKGGVTNLKNMAFFKSIDWDSLASQTLDPPFVPCEPDYEKIAHRKLSQDVDINWEEVHEWIEDLVVPTKTED